jgi:hypothetical protein
MQNIVKSIRTAPKDAYILGYTQYKSIEPHVPSDGTVPLTPEESDRCLHSGWHVLQYNVDESKAKGSADEYEGGYWSLRGNPNEKVDPTHWMDVGMDLEDLEIPCEEITVKMLIDGLTKLVKTGLSPDAVVHVHDPERNGYYSLSSIMFQGSAIALYSDESPDDELAFERPSEARQAYLS